MTGYIKKLLGIGHKTHAVLMEDVAPAAQDPNKEEKVNEAVESLVASLKELERQSYRVRRELSGMSIRIVNKGRRNAVGK